MRIAKKLLVLVIVPLLAVTAFAAVAVAVTSGQAGQAERLRLLAIAGAEAGELAHRLQAERVAAVDALVARPPGAVDSYLDTTVAADDAIEVFREAISALASLPESVAQLLDRVERQLATLTALRQRVVSGQGAASASVFSYRILIADLVSYRESMAQAGRAPADIGDRMRAAAALSRAAEFVGLQQVAVLRVAEAETLTPAASQEITAARTGYAEAELTFGVSAAPEWRQWLDQALTGAEMVAAQRWEDSVARMQPGDRSQIDHAQWTSVMATRLLRLRQVEKRVDAEIVDAVTRLRDDQRLLTAIQSGAVLAVVCVLVALAFWLGRPMIRGLRRLRDAAHQVAYHQLPAAVQRLQDQAALGELTPQQFADRMPSPVPVRGRDELSEVARAFNSVHYSAVRVAAEQAMLRVGIAAMLVTLARRGMGLADRLTAELDKVERDEQDPDRLAVLFRLDLLTTLLRRTNHSLLVLGGDSTARARSADESLETVIRAAQGQIEQYDRVELAAVDEVAMQAHAVDDVAKLLAELMDNSCHYSPRLKAHDGLPRPDVVVFARLLGDRVVVQVIDEGIGIEPDRLQELNRRISSHSQLDLTAVRSMGLTVAGELAARHGIRVELRPGAVRGTVAEVTLPSTLFNVGAPTAATAGASAAGDTRTATAAAMKEPAAPLFKSAQSHRIPAQRIAETSGDLLTAARAPAMDDTVELSLPIFQQVASMWFTTADEPVQSGQSPDAEGPQPVTATWQTPADAGWLAAKNASEPPTGGTTSCGLPKRIPKAQLVPGAVQEQPRPVAEYRDPAAVGATLAAYSRGLTRSRFGRPNAPASSAAANDHQGASA